MAINIPIISSLNTAGFDKAKKEFQSLQGVGAKAGFALKQALVPAIAALGTLSTFGFKAAKSASDLNEEIDKSKIIFGASAKAIENFADTAAKSIGQSKTEALQAAASFGMMGQAAGLTGDELTKFSIDLTKLSSDIASLNNANPAEVALALGAALRGEAEPIRRFNVLMDDAALKAEALALKIYKGTGPLTQQAKILAANSLIFKQTGTAQDNFALTADGAANQQRILSATIKDATANIGQGLLPALDAVLPLLTRFATWASGNAKVFSNVAIAIAAVSAAIIVMNIAIAASPLMLWATAIGALVVAFVAAYSKFEGFRIVVNKVVNAVLGYFEMMINGWISATNLFIKILNGMSTALGFLGINLGKLDEIGSVSLGRLDDTAETAAEKAYRLAKSWSEVQSTISAAKPAIDKTTTSTDKAGKAAKKTAKDTKELTDAQKALKSALEDAIDAIKDKFSPALAKANDLLTTASDKYTEFHTSISDTVKGLLDLGGAFDTVAENKAAYDEALANKTAADQELAGISQDRLDYADALEKAQKAQEAFDKVAGKKRSFFDILGDQARKATELSDGIEQLIDMGLNDPALLQSILASGADTGLEIIKGILAGGEASVEKLVGLSKTVNDAAKRIAELTADKWFKSGVDQAQKIVDGVNSVIANTEFLLKFALDPATAQIIGEQLDAQLGNIFGGGSPMANGGALPTLADLYGPVLGSINAGNDSNGNRYGTTVNVTVQAGLVSTPDQIGQDIIASIQKAQRRSGQVFANAVGVAS